MSQPAERTRVNKGRGLDRPYHNSRYTYNYYRVPYNFTPRWNYYSYEDGSKSRPYRNRYRKRSKKKPSRPSSPLCGTEEYTLRKIQETSDMIKKQLMMPPELKSPKVDPPRFTDRTINKNETKSQEDKSKPARVPPVNSDSPKVSRKLSQQYNIEEIQEKIVNHITNLNYGKKINLICTSSSSSGYDLAIQQIQKQKRLEVSKALRDVCSNQTPESTDFINSIIPDMGIKIEQLPLEVIQELSHTLDLDFYGNSFDPEPYFSNGYLNQVEGVDVSIVKTEACEDDAALNNGDVSEIKKEICEDAALSNLNDEGVRGSDFDTEEPVIKTEPEEMTTGDQEQDISIPDCQDPPALPNRSPSEEPCHVTEHNVSKQPLITEVWFKNVTEVQPKGNVSGQLLTEVRSMNATEVQPRSDVDNVLKQPNNPLITEVWFKKTAELQHKSDVNNVTGQTPGRSLIPMVTPMEIPEEQLTGDVINNSCPTTDVNCAKAPEVQPTESHLRNFEAASGKVSRSTQTGTNTFQCSLNEADVSAGASLEEAVSSMLQIDKEIERLTKLRQLLFVNLAAKDKGVVAVSSGATSDELDKRVLKKRKCVKRKRSKVNGGEEHEAEKRVNRGVNGGLGEREADEQKVEKKVNRSVNGGHGEREADDTYFYKEELNFGNITEKILVIKVLQDTLLAASETGKLFFVSLKDGSVSKTLQISTVPITSLSFWKNDQSCHHLFIGTFETNIKEYSFENREPIKTIEVTGAVQCMEISWNYMFVGTNNGHLLRYSLKKGKIEFEDSVSQNGVLVLKATQEGARRILLVGTRNSPVCVRDAMSGLHMRTMNDLISPTVYSLLLEKSLVFCGTTSHDILVFSFHDGNLLHKYTATNSKGIGCMKVVKNLLFASCHNGNIYVYNTKTHNYIGNIQGPGGVILSMEVVGNIVVVGTMSLNFRSMIIPDFILKYNA